MTMKAAITLLLLLATGTAFQVAPFARPARRPPSVCLRAKKKKRGLADVAAAGAPPPSSRQQAARRSKKKSSATSSSVSPALAEWAASAATTVEPSSATTTTTAREDDGSTFTPFVEEQVKEEEKPSRKQSSRRVKQSQRKEEERERELQVQGILNTLQEVLEETSNLDAVLATIGELLSVSSSNTLRQLTASAKEYNYRLAWVGSDDSLSYIGTGLHKVPLARMEEVFFQCKGRNRIEILEVIRVIGPFPNVRNELSGDSKVTTNNDETLWEIVMDRMVDGTGKEISSGTEDNIRRVNLQVVFADPSAIVAVVPPEEDGEWREDPLEDNGAHMLVFVKEDDLEAKLEKLRVNPKE